MAAGPDFARKLDLVLKTLNLSRARLAQSVGVDKSVVSRWASGVTVPTDHNLSRLTEAVIRHKADFGRHDWDLEGDAFAVRLGIAAPAAGIATAASPSAPRVATPASKEPQLTLPDKPSIAVLPFQNMSGDPEQEYFADGIAEDIITALSKWRWFFVIARNSSFTYKGRTVDLKQVGRDLGVRYVLEGSVRKAAHQVRITAQLIDTSNGAHLWAERYDRNLSDVFTIQDEVTQSVASAIEPALAQNEREQARRKPTEDMAAWDYCLRGSWHFHQFGAVEAEKALICFRRAIELDGNLSDAHVGAARVLFSQAIYGFRSGREAIMEESAQAARRALLLDPQNAYAYYVLALAAAHAGDPATAVVHGRQAVELNPNLSSAYFAIAVASSFAGRPADALVAVDTALRLSPTDPQRFAWLAQRASALYLCKRYDEAIETARQSLAIRWFQTACRVLAASHAQLGHEAPARAAIAELLAAEGAERTIAEAVHRFQRKADRDLYTAGLRKAGMPEG